MRLCCYPLAIFPVFSLLCDLPDIYFRIEVGGKRLAMITGIAVDNIEILQFIKMMFRGICGENGSYTRDRIRSQE